MLRKLLYGVPVFGLAVAILLISILESASVKYAFGAASPTPAGTPAPNQEIKYYFPYEGKILPDSPLWSVKALRDFVWYRLTTNPLKRAEIALLFSDKRIAASQTLFDSHKSGVGLTTLTKSEKYLEVAFQDEETARSEGMDTLGFLAKFSLASLKHREIIDKILEIAPEGARPLIVQTQDYSRNAYKSSRDVLNSKGITPPKSPFSGD